MNLSIHNLGITLGLIFGISLLVYAYLSLFYGLASPIVALLASLYPGYAASLLGGVIGLGYGFVHGYIFGALIVLISNFISML